MTDTTKKTYFGNWAEKDWDDKEGYQALVVDFFSCSETPEDFPKPEDIIFATYTYEDYSGSAQVLFKRDGKLFEVEGSHCSCDGLEGQWHPGEVTWDALNLRYGPGEGARERFNELVAENATPGVKA